MTTSNSIPADAVLVAIDIAKVRNEVLIEAPGHKRRRRLLVLNTRAEHDHLIEVLQAYGRPVVCAFEATGNYHRPIAWRLAEAGFEVRLVSSLALARTREALHNSWDKNDPKDAQVILHMLRIQATQVYHDPLRAGINDVQELSKTHEAIARAKTEIQHRILTHYLPLYFPEIDRFRGNSRSDWFFAFLDAFPTPASITALTKEEFVTAAWDVVGRKVSKTQILMDIYETARSSIGLPLPLDAPAIRMFRMVIDEARSLIRQRNEIEAQADELLRHSQDYQLLRQIPGIGPINALTIIAEAGDLRRFHHHRQFLKVLRTGPLDTAVRPISRPDPPFQIRQCSAAPHPVDRRTSRHPPARERLPAQVRTLHRKGSRQSRSAPQGDDCYYRQDGACRTRRRQKRFRLPALR